jgi:uncharacterized protein
MAGESVSRSAPARVQVIDALRGLALLGMVVVHFHDWAQDGGFATAKIPWAINIFAADKFYPLFACLFGVSFALQFESWGARRDFVWIYLRRLLWLAAFAFVLIATTGYHVLEIYAAWGVVLLAIRKWSNRSLLILAFVWLCVAPARHFAIAIHENRTGVTVEQSNERTRAENLYWRNYFVEQDRLQDARDFTGLVKLRLAHNFGEFLYVPGLIAMANAFLMFLIGMYAVRKGILRDPRTHRDTLLIVIVFGLIVLAFGTDLLPLPALQMANLRVQWAYRSLLYRMLNEEFLGLAYAAALVLLVTYTAMGRRIGAILAYPGRMSLTTYVTQVLILQIFLSTFGLHLTVTHFSGLIAAALVFTLQVFISRWWLGRFRYGPLEWLWRSATFAHWAPFKKWGQ